MANNYNMSSTGYSVEVTAFYDSDLSQMYFNENFISEGNERSLMFTGYEHKEDDFIITVTETDNNRAILIDPIDDNADLFFDDLVSNFNYDNGLKTIHDKLTEYERAGLDYECNFSTIISRGYSQGDDRAVYVLSDHEAYVTHDYINNLLWDAPITARVTINGEDELFEDDILGDDFYKWDKEEVKIRVTAALSAREFSAACIAEVLALIPVTPKYL